MTDDDDLIAKGKRLFESGVHAPTDDDDLIAKGKRLFESGVHAPTDDDADAEGGENCDADADGPTTLYTILGVRQDASADEIKAAYRRLAREFHPDLSLGDPDAAQRFREVKDAYDVLSDPGKRQFYDDELAAAQPVNGAELLDDLVAWFKRFIAVTHGDDLPLLALWAVHTHLVTELYTTPRLLIDSIMEGCGKTTVIDHLNRLCVHPVQAASISSPALLPRLLDQGMRTILIDEAHRALRPDKPGVEDLIGIINTGYRVGATRPVLVPTKGGGWRAEEMPTFAPVAMAGNHPNLPADTASRQLRILLMPDIDGTVEDSDWEHIDVEVKALHDRTAEWADSVRDTVKGMNVNLPDGCIGRTKERWRPLARVAAAAGGDWPAIVKRLIKANMEEEQAEREAGLKTLPPGMVIMKDLFDVWPVEAKPNDLVPTKTLRDNLIMHNPDYWGSESPYGKPLTEQRLGRLVSGAAKITTTRIGGAGPRGYQRTQLEPAWHRLGIGRNGTGETGYTGETGGGSTDATGSTASTGSTGSKGRSTGTGGAGCFTPPKGGGRCRECGFHVKTQGHRGGCQQI